MLMIGVNDLVQSPDFNPHNIKVTDVEVIKVAEMFGDWHVVLQMSTPHHRKAASEVVVFTGGQMQCNTMSRTISKQLGWYVGEVLPGAMLNDPVFRVSKPNHAVHTGIMFERVVCYDPRTNSHYQKEVEKLKAIKTPEGLTVLLNNCTVINVDTRRGGDEGNTVSVVTNSGREIVLFTGSFDDCEDVENRILNYIGAEVMHMEDVQSYGTGEHVKTVRELQERIKDLESELGGEVELRKQFADEMSDVVNRLSGANS